MKTQQKLLIRCEPGQHSWYEYRYGWRKADCFWDDIRRAITELQGQAQVKYNDNPRELRMGFTIELDGIDTKEIWAFSLLIKDLKKQPHICRQMRTVKDRCRVACQLQRGVFRP